jgi:hypothetical protein
MKEHIYLRVAKRPHWIGDTATTRSTDPWRG